MKNTSRRNIIDLVLDEYVNWGGPVVTRREALADAKLRGFTDREIDIAIFGRRTVEAPADVVANVAFLSRIRQLEGIAA